MTVVQNIKIITIDYWSVFNQSINNLPNSIQYIKLPARYNFEHKIDNVPLSLKTILCSKHYFEHVTKSNNFTNIKFDIY